MKKVELLCPVGNVDMLKSAIHNGADAVYLSGIKYGARKFAANFTDEELVSAIKYAHLYGVKVYVTINTLIYGSEVDDFIEDVKFLHINNVDAVLMQDIGMIGLVHKICPNLEIHASTQAHNHNEQGIEFLKNLGVKRVVMAREMSLDQIKSINIDLEKEVFVYGALCVCYSGCCLFSSLNGGRSGNRGECVGSCRLPYKLYKNDIEVNLDGDYPLSMKELNTTKHIKELLESEIDSLKIEGRMKSPYYVGYVTRVYRNLIDNYYNKKDESVSEEITNNLKKLFNRDFTDGFLFNTNCISNIETPNHQGVEIGKVIKIDKKYIYIKLLNDDLNQEDGIRFKNSNTGMIVNRLYNQKELLVNSINKNDICLVDNKVDLKVNDIVLKTIDKKLINSLTIDENKKIPIDLEVSCYMDKPINIKVTDLRNTIELNGAIVSKALKHEVSDLDIERQVSKVGNTPFVIRNLEIKKDDGIFINLKDINELRRNILEELIKIRENYIPNEVLIIENETINQNINDINDEFKINVLVRNEEQLKCCLDNHVNNIYVTDYNLYKKYKNNNIFYRLERVNNNYINYKDENLLVGEIGSIQKYGHDNILVGDYFLNVANKNTIKLLSDNNLKQICLSIELSDNEIESIKDYNNVELLVYGRIELMVMKYCLLKENLNYCKQCKNSNDIFSLKDAAGNQYPLIRNICLSHIMHYKPIDKINNISNYKKMGINIFRVELFDENYENTAKIINNVKHS